MCLSLSMLIHRSYALRKKSLMTLNDIFSTVLTMSMANNLLGTNYPTVTLNQWSQRKLPVRNL